MKNKTGDILDWKLFKRVLALALPFKNVFIGATLMAILLAILSPIRPYIVQHTIDNYILKLDGEGLTNMVYILIGLLLITAISRYFFIYATNWLGQSIIKQLRVRVFKHISNLKLKFFDQTPVGTAVTRTISDIETINNIFAQGIITIFADVLTLFAVLGFMLYTNWQLTLISLIPLPFLIWATYIFKEKVKKAFQKVRAQISIMNAFLQEHITGMKVIQIFNAEEREMKAFKKINKDHRDANVAAIWAYSVFFPVVEIISASSIGLMVWWGAKDILISEASPGILIAFILYLYMLFRPIRMLADKFNTLQMGLVASERVFDILDTDRNIENNGTLNIDKFEGKISFKDVWFAYNKDNFVLKNINFELNAGESLALVGSTGSGKSSIINILSRFYEINKGQILIDDKDVRAIELSCLRSKIAVVLQDVFLFSGTVMDNIRLKAEEITEEEVITAAKMIGAHEFISELPNGYDYQVMERGATLSVGQRQLISFVRALVFNPDILILDEATSSVDTESEAIIQYAIEKLIEKRTSIIVAHRLSTIQHVDKIIVLNKGEIMEEGNHQALLEKDGWYKKLHDMQFLQTST